MVFVCCDCGNLKKKCLEPFKELVCPKCGSKLSERLQLSLSMFVKVRNYRDLEDDGLDFQTKRVYDAFKVLEPCSDQQVADYLKIKRSSVNGRRNNLVKDFSVPLIVPHSKGLDKETKRPVTLWKVNKVKDVEKELEVKLEEELRV